MHNSKWFKITVMMRKIHLDLKLFICVMVFTLGLCRDIFKVKLRCGNDPHLNDPQK